MSKPATAQRITTAYLDDASYFEEYPDLLANAKKEEDYIADVILAVAKKIKYYQESSRTRDYSLLDKTTGLTHLLGDKVTAIYDNLTTTNLATACQELAKIFNLPQAVATGSAPAISSGQPYSLEAMIKDAVSRLKVTRGEIEGEQRAKDAILAAGRLPRTLWSPEGKQADLLIKSLGYTKDIPGTLVDNKGETGFYVASFTQAEFVPDPTGTGASSYKIEIPVSEASQSALEKQLADFRDPDGKEVFRNIQYHKGSGRLAFEVKHLASPITAIKYAVEAVRNGEQAVNYNRRRIQTKDSDSNLAIGATANIMTAGLAAPVSLAVAASAGMVHDAARKTNWRWVPFLGEASQLVATSAARFARFSATHVPFLSRWSGFKSIATAADGIVDNISNNEYKHLSETKLGLVTAVPFAAACTVASTCLRGANFLCSGVGDYFAYKAQAAFEDAKKPAKTIVEWGSKISSGASAVILGTLAAPFRICGTIAEGLANTTDTATTGLKGRKYVSFLSTFTNEMRRACDNRRYFKGHDHRFIQLDVHHAPDKAKMEEDNFRGNFLRALNNSRDLKFNRSSGIKGDANVYALMETVEHNGKTYEILGSFDGETMTIIDPNPPTTGENRIGDYPVSIPLTHANTVDGLGDFERKVFMKMQALNKKAQQDASEQRGISLAEFREAFSNAANPNEEQEKAKGILTGGKDKRSVAMEALTTEALVCEGYQVKKSSTNGDNYSISFSSTKKESGNVDFKSNAFFNFVQGVAHGEGKREALRGGVKKPKASAVATNNQLAAMEFY